MPKYSREQIDEIVAQTRPVHYKVKVVDSEGNEIDPSNPPPPPEPVHYKVKVVSPQQERQEQAEELIQMFAEWMVENGHENDGLGFDSPLWEQWVNQLDG